MAAVQPVHDQLLPTRQIANHFRMSAYTVKDHLKSIFSKTGTGTRLFFDQRATQVTAPPAIPDELRGVSATARPWRPLLPN